MNAALNLARAYALVIGAAFLFGQAFTGYFSIAATLAGVSGVLACVLDWLLGDRARRVVTVASVAGLVGVATDAIHYYRELDIPGSYYAWFLVAPFVVALVFIGYSSVRRR
jgi:hypothetical protein